MLGSTGFDLWADGYDKSVKVSDDDGTYPFAGYKNILNEIYGRVLSSAARKVLDIGFGTATLTSKLYEAGCSIFGMDFSERMIELAQVRMPNAKLHCGDFTYGLSEELTRDTYDAIIATYSLHHLTDTQKVSFIKSLIPLLNKGGCIYIGDVAFRSRVHLEECKKEAESDWDDDEIYFVFDELKEHFPTLQFQKFSYCSGILTVKKECR